MNARPVSWEGFNAWAKSDWINPFGYKAFSWVDFTFAHASLELDRRFGNFDGHFAILGLHIGFSWHISGGDKEFIADLEKTMKELGISDPDEYAADDVPHPFGGPDALTGNITSPIGAHSFEAIKEAHEDSSQAIGEVPHRADAEAGQYVSAAINRAKDWRGPNPVNQQTGD